MINFIVLYDNIDACIKCNSKLKPFMNNFNLQKCQIDDTHNTVFVLYKCESCQIKYTISISLFKCIVD